MKKVLLSAVAMIMIVALSIKIMTPEEYEKEPSATFIDELVTKNKTSKSIENAELNILTGTELDGLEYKRCESLTRNLTNRIRRWQNQQFILPSFIVNKYSSDDVLVALEAFGLSQQDYVNNHDTQRETMSVAWKRSESNNYHPPKEFLFSFKGGPRKYENMRRFFKEFLKLPAAERRSQVQNIPIIVNDIATMFRDGFSEDEIINVLHDFEDINSVISKGREHVREFGLIDKAAAAGYLKVFNYLIERGAVIENRPASLNTLEFAIFHSSGAARSYPMVEKRDAFEQIIRTLRDYHLPLRIREDRFSKKYYLLGGAGSQRSYQMPKVELMDFYRKLGVDFDQKIDRNHFKSIANQELLFELEEHLKSELFQNEDTNEQDIDNCNDHLSNVKHTLTRNDTHQIIEQTITKHSGHSDEVIKELQSIEPGLVDMYKWTESQARQPQRFNVNFNSPTEEIYRLLTGEEYEKADEYLVTKPLSDDEKHAVFWRVVKSDTKHISFLVENGLVPQYSDYREAARLTQYQLDDLDAHGYNFKEFDDRNKSLVFYAAFMCNASLINHLLKEGYPYRYDDVGEEPLSAAIRYSECPRWASVKYDANYDPVSVIEAVLLFKPKIHKHHLERMAELKLLKFDIYKKVIEKIPQLAVDDGILPSGYYIEYQEMWSGIKYQQ